MKGRNFADARASLSELDFVVVSRSVGDQISPTGIAEAAALSKIEDVETIFQIETVDEISPTDHVHAYTRFLPSEFQNWRVRVTGPKAAPVAKALEKAGYVVVKIEEDDGGLTLDGRSRKAPEVVDEPEGDETTDDPDTEALESIEVSND